MGARGVHPFPPVLTVPFTLILLRMLPQSAALPCGGPRVFAANAPGSEHCAASMGAESVAQRTEQICGNVQIEEALNTVGLGTTASTATMSKALNELGFRSALDLRLLAGWPEAEELMVELKSAGLLTADRAKLRLLIGRRPGLQHIHSQFAAESGALIADNTGGTSECKQARAVDATSRRMQEQSSSGSGSSGGFSMDTIAIVFSVLVGTAGYGARMKLLVMHFDPGQFEPLLFFFETAGCTSCAGSHCEAGCLNCCRTSTRGARGRICSSTGARADGSPNPTHRQMARVSSLSSYRCVRLCVDASSVLRWLPCPLQRLLPARLARIACYTFCTSIVRAGPSSRPGGHPS
eukprot:SAG31_NODE_5064_length_2763_cov_1.885135_3_plen_351_part_00